MGKVKGSNPAIVRNVLTLKEQLMLSKHTVEKYRESGMTNIAFAESINAAPALREQLRFNLNASHIQSILAALDIPSNRVAKQVDMLGDTLGLTARVAALEDRVERLAKTIATLTSK